MASSKVSNLVDLAGAQVPADLFYVVDVSAGVAGSKKSTLNDVFSIITKNITDGAVRFQGFVAPALSAAGQGALFFSSAANQFQISENGGAFVAMGNVRGPASATDNAIARFDGATGKIIQDSALTVADTSGNFTVPNAWQASSAGGVFIALGSILFTVSTPTTGTSGFSSIQVISGSQTQSSGVAQIVGLTATLNQTGTAGASSLSIARTETALGSGQHDFIRGFGGALGATEKFRISNTGQYFAGSPSTSTGQFVMAVSGSANTQALQGADTPASSLTFKWPSADPAANQVLTGAAPVAGVVTLTWTTPGGGGTPGGADTQVQFNNAGAFGGVSGFTSNGTNVTAGSGNLRASRPQFTTSIDDSNGNEVFVITATASAVNEFTVANAATGGNPTISTSGGDANIPFVVSPKGTGRFESTGPLRLSGTGTDTFTTPASSGVPTKINIPLFSPGAFGQILAFGLTNAAPNSARVLSLFDQRGAGHQPTIQIFNPNEDALLGFTWDGSNSIGQVTTDQILQLSAIRIIQKMPATAPTDADIPNSFLSIYTDEGANNLIFRVRDSGGTLQTATLALT